MCSPQKELPRRFLPVGLPEEHSFLRSLKSGEALNYEDRSVEQDSLGPHVGDRQRPQKPVDLNARERNATQSGRVAAWERRYGQALGGA